MKGLPAGLAETLLVRLTPEEQLPKAAVRDREKRAEAVS